MEEETLVEVAEKFEKRREIFSVRLVWPEVGVSCARLLCAASSRIIGSAVMVVIAVEIVAEAVVELPTAVASGAPVPAALREIACPC
jgi:hypothetical protein